jgi:predicted small lipoprotein YifL
MLRVLLILTLGVLMLAGCGQKGPLYLPNDKQPDISKPAHVRQEDKAVAMGGAKQAEAKTASAAKPDDSKSGVDNDLNSGAIKPDSKTNSGTVHVSGS